MTPTDRKRRQNRQTIGFSASEDELDWLKHAAKLRGLSLVEYMKRAINAELRRAGVDAVLLKENGKA